MPTKQTEACLQNYFRFGSSRSETMDHEQTRLSVIWFSNNVSETFQKRFFFAETEAARLRNYV